MDGDTHDDVSLEGEYARAMFRDEDPSVTTGPHQQDDSEDPEMLRIQAAKTSDDVLTRFLEGMKKQMEASLGVITSKIGDLDQKYELLAQQFQNNTPPISSVSEPAPALSSPVLNPNKTCSVSTADSLDSNKPNAPVGHMAMEVEETPDTALTDNNIKVAHERGVPSTSTGPPSVTPRQCFYDRDLGHNPRDESYKTRKIDSIRLRPLEKKLENEEQFKYWKRSVLGQVGSQECLFVLDPAEATPPEFTLNDIKIIKRKVRYFVVESMSQYFQDLVQDYSDPKDILDKLQGVCDPSSTYQLKGLVNAFNSIHYDPKSEKAIEFLNRFDELRKKLASINPNMLTPEYTKIIFELAIDETVTYQRAELQSFKFTLPELRDMLLEEQLWTDQQANSMGSSYSMFRNRVASSRGRGGARGRGGRGGRIPGQPQNFQPRSFQPRHVSSMSKPQSKKGSYCVYCKRRGHDVQICMRAQKLCFNCRNSDKHQAADCPHPKKPIIDSSKATNQAGSTQTAPNQSKYGLSRPNLSKPTSSSKAPKMFKMPMGQAKKLAQVFKDHPDSIFAIVGPMDAPNNEPVWVTMGSDEGEYVGMANLLSEQHGTGKAFKVSEGKNCFSAIIDSGCTEHLTSSREILSNFKRLPTSRTFKCANSDENADLSVNYSGDIDFINNGKISKLQNVLYAPGLAMNLFSVRKVTQSGINVLFSKDKVEFIQISTGQTIKTGRFHNNLWWIDFDVVSTSTEKQENFIEIADSKRRKVEAFQCQPRSSSSLHIPCIDVAQVGGSSSASTSHSDSNGPRLGGRENNNGNPLGQDNPDSGDNLDSLDIKISKFDKNKLTQSFNDACDLDILWHLRLNHASKRYMDAAKKFLPELKYVNFTNNISNCEDCHQANTSRKSHTQVRHRGDKPFSRLHTDLMGPISPANFRTGDSYIVIFVCDYSRYVFAYTLKNKKEVHIALGKCLQEIESITSETKNVFRLRSDRGLEFQTTHMKDLMSEKGITWDPCQPYVPQQNGCAERVNQEIKHRIRVNLNSAKMPYSFWGHALNYVIFVYNRMPHSANNFASPFELVKGYSPSLKFLRRFGCLVHYVDVKNKSKFAPNAKKGFLLECNDTGYVIFCEQHKTLVNSCDVKCIESIVYGDRIKDYPRPLAEILEMGDDLDSNDQSNSNPSTAAVLQRENIYVEPSSYREAMSSPDCELWEEAIRSELDSLQEMGTWELVPKSSVPTKNKIIKSRWIHKRKVEVDGTFKYKSRLVIKGFADTNEYLISEVYAPVARLSDVRVFLSAINKLGMHLFQLDVTTAFLHGDLEKPVYMEIPEGLVELTDAPDNLNDSFVCNLKKALYGLKVSPNLWYKKFRGILHKLGFEEYPFQTCIFRWKKDSKYALLIIYVDDCLLASNDNDVAIKFISKLQKEVKIKNLGAPKKFLGFEIIRKESENFMFIHQRTTIENILNKFLPPEHKVSEIPMVPSTCTLASQLELTESNLPSPDVPYREVIGSLLYIQNGTRPDISFAVNFMSRKQVGYTESDWKCVLKILAYLKGTMDYGLLFSGKSEDLIGYSDSNLGTSDLNGKSTTGFSIMICGDLVSWKSKKQAHVALSTCQAEYIAMSETCKELISVQSLWEFLTGVKFFPKLKCDCAPAIAVAMTNESKTLKHIVKLCMHYVHELYKNKCINLEWVSTNHQIADTFTKPLTQEKFVYFRNLLLATPDSAP